METVTTVLVWGGQVGFLPGPKQSILWHSRVGNRATLMECAKPGLDLKRKKKACKSLEELMAVVRRAGLKVLWNQVMQDSRLAHSAGLTFV